MTRSRAQVNEISCHDLPYRFLLHKNNKAACRSAFHDPIPVPILILGKLPITLPVNASLTQMLRYPHTAKVLS